MNPEQFSHTASTQVVLADANVLYSRVLRDYLLYAATRRVITVNWSQAILSDVAQHMSANIPGFTRRRATYLVDKLNEAFPDASVEPGPNDRACLAPYALPDDDDREVMAAALAAGADIICTNNSDHFPPAIMADLGIAAMTADELSSDLINLRAEEMLGVHLTVVRQFQGATDASTIAVLRRAQAPRTADAIAALVGLT